MTAEKIIYGKIYTADANHTVAEAMAIADGKILAVGNAKEMEIFTSEKTECITVDGLVVPGMTEGHAHITCSTEMLYGIPLGIEKEPEKYLDKIRNYMEKHPEEDMIIGSGYDNGVFGKMGPTAQLLDQVSKEIPIVMIASDHHSRWLNTKALELAGIDENTENPPSGEVVHYPGTRKPTGWLKEAAMSLATPVIKPLTERQFANAILYYQEIALKNGITLAFEPMYDCNHDYVERVKGYELLAKENKLEATYRIGYTIESTDDFEKEFATMNQLHASLASYEKAQLNTTKFFVDGVVECHTAYLREDYADVPGDRGEPAWEQKAFDEAVCKVAEAGYDVHTHVIGDGAVDITLNAYEAAMPMAKEKNLRYALTHLQVVQPDQIERMAKNSILAVVNPYWHFCNPVYYDELELPFLGQERAKKEYPMKSFWNQKIPMSQASDYPVTVPPRTMDSLHLMVNRMEPGNTKNPEMGTGECMTVEEALDILTIGGAYQLRLEDTKGSLEAGKDADFVLLSQDVLTTEKTELYKTEVVATYIAGKKVYSAS